MNIYSDHGLYLNQRLMIYFKNSYFQNFQNDEMQTQPPPRFKYAETVNQSVIYDAYVKYEELKEQQDDDGNTKKVPSTLQKETSAAIKRLLAEKTVDKNAEVNKKLLKAARTLERMVNQNTYHDIAQGINNNCKTNTSVECFRSIKASSCSSNFQFFRF